MIINDFILSSTLSVVYSSIQIEIFYKPVWILQYTELVKKKKKTFKKQPCTITQYYH